MNAVLFVVAFLLLFGLWAVGAGLAWHRIDRLEADKRRADKRAAVAEAAAEQWEHTARASWAEVDGLLADQQRHAAACPWAQAEPADARSN